MKEASNLTFVDPDELNECEKNSETDSILNGKIVKQKDYYKTNVLKSLPNVLLHSMCPTEDLKFQDVDDLDSAVNIPENINKQQDDKYDDIGNGSQDSTETVSQTDTAEHCRYCLMDDPSTLVRCNICKSWFCNGKGNTSGAHIINHLVRSKHKEVTLHKDGPLSNQDLECYSCGAKNLFILGFIPAKSDSVVIILCRSPCTQLKSLKDLEWDSDSWKPLINSDRSLLPWLARIPTGPEQIKKCRSITPSQIRDLEELWKEEPSADLTDLEKYNESKYNDYMESLTLSQPKVQLQYDNAYHYERTYSPLIKLESDYDKQLKESMTLTDIPVRWDTGLNQKYVAYLEIPINDAISAQTQSKVMAGDELRLRYLGELNKPWASNGHVIHANHATGEVAVEMKSNQGVPYDRNTQYAVDFVWKSTAFDRMSDALKKIVEDGGYGRFMSPTIYKYLMGQGVQEHDNNQNNKNSETYYMPKIFSVPNLAYLNKSQIQAVKEALTNQVTLIQGPPGTGKTVTSASIVYHIAQKQKKLKESRYSSKSKILVCAPSNTAVDNLCAMIHDSGIKVVRVCAKSREAVATAVNHLTLHNKIKELRNGSWEELHKLQELKDLTGELTKADGERYKKLKTRAEREIISNAEVLCCTCITSGSPLFTRNKELRFSAVLIDEAMQATEPECLPPIILGAEQLILVGDHCQLGPVVMCKKAEEGGLDQSLFERLYALGHKAARLDVQYRMHPKLSEFPSNYFYDGSLQNGISADDRKISDIVSQDFPWPETDVPMFFFNACGQEELSGTGTSFLNRSEATIIEKLTTKLLSKCNLKPSQIGIITPYEGQRAHIIQYMITQGTLSEKSYQEVEIASVDAFQGREKDIILISCVRSNENQGIGFLADPRRLNVAISRARYAMIVIGNARVLSRQPIWNHLLQHFKNQEVLIEGSLGSMIKSRMQFPVLKKFCFQSGRRRLQMDMPVSYPHSLSSDTSKNNYVASNPPFNPLFGSNIHSHSRPLYSFPPPTYPNASSNLGLNYYTLKGNLKDAVVTKDDYIDGSIGGETFTQSIGGETYQTHSTGGETYQMHSIGGETHQTQGIGGETYPTQSIGGETFNSLSQSNFHDMVFSWHKAPRQPHDRINAIDPIKTNLNASNRHLFEKSVASLGTDFPVPLGIFVNSQDVPPRFNRQKNTQNKYGSNSALQANNHHIGHTPHDNTQLSQGTLYDKYLSAHSTQYDGYDPNHSMNLISQIDYQSSLSQLNTACKSQNDSNYLSLASQDKGSHPGSSMLPDNKVDSTYSQKSTVNVKPQESESKFDPGNDDDFPQLTPIKTMKNISNSNENYLPSIPEKKSNGFVPFRKTVKMRRGITDG